MLLELKVTLDQEVLQENRDNRECVDKMAQRDLREYREKLVLLGPEVTRAAKEILDPREIKVIEGILELLVKLDQLDAMDKEDLLDSVDQLELQDKLETLDLKVNEV